MAADSPPEDFYQSILQILDDAEVPCLIGGAFALRIYTGMTRDTKDFDLMLRPQDADRAIRALKGEGYHAGIVFPHWLAKVHLGDQCVDMIYNSGNGLCPVDDVWFQNARECELWNRVVRICPPEEFIWQKSFIMERERFDGADVAHLLRSCAAMMNWPRLLERFGTDWRVLLSHLVLFGYIYPSKQALVPSGFMNTLLRRAMDEALARPDEGRICQGTFLSREQYLDDVEKWGFVDARTTSRCAMSAEEIELWTSAIPRPGR